MQGTHPALPLSRGRLMDNLLHQPARIERYESGNLAEARCTWVIPAMCWQLPGRLMVPILPLVRLIGRYASGMSLPVWLFVSIMIMLTRSMPSHGRKTVGT